MRAMCSQSRHRYQQRNPTNTFTILELCYQEIGEFYVFQERLATDFEAQKLLKGSSG